jgi:dihydroflavonol-4-reductase
VARTAAWTVGGVACLLGRHPPLCPELMRTLLHGHAYDGSRATRELGLTYTPVRVTLTRTLRWFAEQGLLTRTLPGLASEV